MYTYGNFINFIKPILYWFQDKLFVLIGTLFVLLPTSPMNSPYASRDSGVFLYTGWRILNGDIPYVHIWDHKPPIVFYINAFGLWLIEDSRWGVWIIEFVSLFTATYLGFILLRKIFGIYPAIVSTFLWLMSLVFLILNGNLTEEYILPLQFSAIFIFYSSRNANRKRIHYLLLGVLGGIAFFTKQTSIGLWLAIILFLGFESIKEKKFRNSVKEISYIILGSLLVFILISTYFVVNDAFYEFWDSAFIFNIYYSREAVSTLTKRLVNLTEISYITKTGIYHIAALGIATFIYGLKHKKLDLNGEIVALLLVAMIDLPLELLIINLPGRAFDHYFITALPTLAIFSGFLFFVIYSKIFIQKHLLKEKVVFALLTIGLLGFGSFRYYGGNVGDLQYRMKVPAIEYIVNNSYSADSVLVWGGETRVNFYSQRIIPTRYVYPYPLFVKGYTSEEKITEFLDDIINNKPKIIIDTMEEDYPIFTFPIQNNNIDRKTDLIKSMYLKVDMVNSWQVYELITD